LGDGSLARDRAGRRVHPRGVLVVRSRTRVGLVLAAPQVLQRAARDPEQEQVQHGQEAELQADGDRIERDGGHYPRSNVTLDVPISITSPPLRASAPPLPPP